MLDRFSRTLGVAEVYPGIPVCKKKCSVDYLGTASKILDELNPPTKVLGKFLKRWRDRQTITAECFKTTLIPPSINRQDTSDVTLTISKRLVAVVKAKDILHIEAGLEMIALAMSISSENGGMFPEMPGNVKNVLRSIWESKMDQQQFEDISTEIHTLHKPMKNLFGIVFAISPLLALSTHGWDFHSVHSTYLLRIFLALGNDRPQILVQLEDRVLHAILAISEGTPPEDVIDTLYSEVLSLEKDLGNDDEALNWFNLSVANDSILPTPPSSAFPLTRFQAMPNLFKGMVQGGLASPPDSHSNTPLFSNILSSASSGFEFEKLSPPEFVNPKYLRNPSESLGDELERQEPFNSTDQEVGALGEAASSSSFSPDTSEDEDGENPKTAIESKKPSSYSSEVEEECGPKINSESRMFVSEDGKGECSTKVKSNELVSGPTEVKERADETISVQSKKSKSDLSDDEEDVNHMIGVESNEPSLDSVEDKSMPMAGVELKGPPDDDEKGDPAIGSEPQEPSLDSAENRAADVELKEPLDDDEKGDPNCSEPQEPSLDLAENRVNLMMDIESNGHPYDEGNDTMCGESQAQLLNSVEKKENDKIVLESRELPFGDHEGHRATGADSQESSLDSAEDNSSTNESNKQSVDDDSDRMNGVEPQEPLTDPPEDKGDSMINAEHKEPSDLAKDDEGHPMTGVTSTELSDSLEDKGNPIGGFNDTNTIIDMELSKMSLDSDQLEVPFEPRRNSRNADRKKKTPLKIVTPPKLSGGKRKPAFKMDAIVLESDSEEDWPRLSKVEKAKYVLTISAEISGWGSTVEMGPKPYQHVAVQIVSPGNVASTGDDTETLRKVEARIKANFKNGLPPHLQPNAKSMSYSPGTDQSRIFITSSSEFSGLNAREVQSVLRDRLILVHGNLFDYNYGWDLESFGRVYDVKPDIRHHLGTLREFHKITMTLSNEDCPPLNAISLPAHRRNLYIPCQFGSLASHKVAQSRVPVEYDKRFDVPDLKSKVEWSLIGGRGAISPFHVDSEGFVTIVVVLEGSKYWIVATGLGEHEKISNVDSLGPNWNPYFINEGDNVDHFRFEGVHLQKGDMLVMPPGIPHWVLGTSNAICVGRFFYGTSTISTSIITIVHTFLLGGAVTNEDYLETRTFLYQLLVFWAMRTDKTDVDGAHIPVMSSVTGFFDILYLGIFVILSTAFDSHFYHSIKPPHALIEEVTYAIRHFHFLLHIFSRRFIILLDGEAVTVSYVVDRMLGEFSAASIVFAKVLGDPKDGNDSYDETEDRITFPMFSGHIEGILHESYPRVVPYYLRCLDQSHKHFLWTIPNIQILPRSEDIVSILPLTTMGELLDLPTHQIYPIEVDEAFPTDIAQVGKHHDREEGVDLAKEHPNKRKRMA